MQDLWTVLGPEGSKIVVWVVLGLGIAIAIAILIWLLMKLFGRSLNIAGSGGRGQPQRLGITGAFNVDRKGRKLVILRRDNVEHLVLIGGPNDVLVESNIVRAQGARPQAARGDTAEANDTTLPPPVASPAPPVAPVAPPALTKPAQPPVPAPPPPRREVLPEPPPVAARAPEPAAVSAKLPDSARAVPPIPPPAPVVADVRAPAPSEPAASVASEAPEPSVKPARPTSPDPRLSDMARRLQSVLQKPLTPAPKPAPNPEAAAMAESIPIPLPSARKPSDTAPIEPLLPATAPKAAAPPPVTQGNALPDAADKPQLASIDSLEEEMARLLGRSDPAKT